MDVSSGEYTVGESILTVVIGAAVGIAAATLFLITGWPAAGSGSVLVAAGYCAMMLVFRAMDRRRGRSAASIGQIVAGSIATGLAAMALPRVWTFLAGP
jgi:hypothetical protein